MRARFHRLGSRLGCGAAIARTTGRLCSRGRRVRAVVGAVERSRASRVQAWWLLPANRFASGTRGLDSGNDIVLVAGPSSAYAAAQGLLGALGGGALGVGEEPGQAVLMQQINGALFAVLLAATCESYVAGARAGLDPLTMRQILGLETGRNAASSHIVPEQVITRRFAYGKSLGEACRDLDGVSECARALGVTPWVLDKARLLYRLAVQLGSAADDVTTLVKLYEKWARVEVRSPLAPS